MSKTSKEKTENVTKSTVTQPTEAKTEVKEPKKVDKKQLVVGLIILVVALLLLFVSFHKEPKDIATASNEPAKENQVVEKKEADLQYRIVPAKIVEQKVENVVFVFTATTDKALHYKLYYTTENDADFDEDHVIELEGKAGKNTYNISIPEEKITRFRLNFGTDIGIVTMSDIYLTGTQTMDLNNLFQYIFFQIVDLVNHGDGSFSFEMIDYHAYMEYRTPLQ